MATMNPPHPEPLELYRGAQNLTTPHRPADYPAELRVVVPCEWSFGVIILEDGQSFVARGGERLIAYRTAHGGIAQGFTLRPGDRVTRLRSDLPHAFAEWQVQRFQPPAN